MEIMCHYVLSMFKEDNCAKTMFILFVNVSHQRVSTMTLQQVSFGGLRRVEEGLIRICVRWLCGWLSQLDVSRCG